MYLVQKRIDMLPKPLTEDICSLRSGVDRLAFSVLWEMTDEAEITGVRCATSCERVMKQTILHYRTVRIHYYPRLCLDSHVSMVHHEHNFLVMLTYCTVWQVHEERHQEPRGADVCRGADPNRRPPPAR